MRAELGFAFEPDLLTEVGVGAEAVDRAGYGRSDLADDFDLLARARDALTVAETPGMGRFAVHGTSGGGPVALACAALAPERVTAVVQASCAAQPDAPGADREGTASSVDQWPLVLAASGRERDEAALVMRRFSDPATVVQTFVPRAVRRLTAGGTRVHPGTLHDGRRGRRQSVPPGWDRVVAG